VSNSKPLQSKSDGHHLHSRHWCPGGAGSGRHRAPRAASRGIRRQILTEDVPGHEDIGKTVFKGDLGERPIAGVDVVQPQPGAFDPTGSGAGWPPVRPRRRPGPRAATVKASRPVPEPISSTTFPLKSAMRQQRVVVPVEERQVVVDAGSRT
jgi:hypothetical protein